LNLIGVAVGYEQQFGNLMIVAVVEQIGNGLGIDGYSLWSRLCHSVEDSLSPEKWPA
jgi:hypothetical protein